ncbi:MAG TPA: type II toxin-antitoxin system VapC family toxin [Solirubrobacterales bacterium]|nr:type II toxin-antitoxin system VapC family toxin [Solirubrobacterales bacterium]
MAEPPEGRGVIDTSVVIGYESVDASRLPLEVSISTLTLAELSAGPLATSDELERARRQERLQRFESGIETLVFDAACARAYAHIYAASVASGRKPRGARAVDLMIAATALAYDLPLFTLNAKDFRGLELLIKVVDVSR